jgi:peptide-methionine (S)-S-oxide reductase
LAPAAGEDERRIALALAAQHGRTQAVQALLEAGADPASFTPPPGHSHATPLHQAALAGHEDIAQLLLAHGARLDLRDILYNGTPADWAEHNHFEKLAAQLRR